MIKESLFVFAVIKPKAEYFSHAQDAVLAITSQTRLEEGCIQFVLHKGESDSCLYLYEEWESESALMLHYQQPYTKLVFGNYQDWLIEPVNIIKMQSI